MPTFHPPPASVLAIAVLVLIAFIVCGASVALCWSHLARIRRAASEHTLALAHALKRLPPETRVDALVQKTPQEAWEHQWARALATCSSVDARVAVTNELLVDLAHQLSTGSRWPAAATRISALGALLLAALAFLAGGHPLVVGCILAMGVGSAVACAALGMRAQRAAACRREAVDSLVDAALGSPLRGEDRLRRRSDRHGRGRP